MNLLQSLLYGLISGLSEFTPVSTSGHQALLRKLFGAPGRNPLLDLLVGVGLLIAVYLHCRSLLMSYSRQLRGNPRRRRGNIPTARRTYDLRFLFFAGIAMLALLLFRGAAGSTEQKPLYLCLFFVLNGIVLYAVDHMRQSNKDAGMLSGMDAIFTGLMGGLSIFPGFSRLGMNLSAAVARGADRTLAYNWALVLGIPALTLFMLFDFIGLFTVAGFVISLTGVLYAFAAAIGAFAGGYLVISLMRMMIVNTGFSGYACYCWGVAMLNFILYLIA